MRLTEILTIGILFIPSVAQAPLYWDDWTKTYYVCYYKAGEYGGRDSSRACKEIRELVTRGKTGFGRL